MSARSLATPNMQRRIAIKSIAFGAALMPGIGTFWLKKEVFAAQTAPADIERALGNPRSQGQSRLVVFCFNIYDARLWTDGNFSAERYANERFALELKYLRNFSGASISERSLKEMRRLAEVSDAQAAQWLVRMKQIFPDVKKGDQLIGLHRPDGSASFILNGKPIGEVSEPEFSRLFFGIWLSPQTSQPKMRRELIGAASSGK
jgi:hypothetical protein